MSTSCWVHSGTDRFALLVFLHPSSAQTHAGLDLVLKAAGTRGISALALHSAAVCSQHSGTPVLMPNSPWGPVMGWTCGNASNCTGGRCGLDIKKALFTERLVKNQNRFFREVVDIPSLSVLKKYLDNALI